MNYEHLLQSERWSETNSKASDLVAVTLDAPQYSILYLDNVGISFVKRAGGPSGWIHLATLKISIRFSSPDHQTHPPKGIVHHAGVCRPNVVLLLPPLSGLRGTVCFVRYGPAFSRTYHIIPKLDLPWTNRLMILLSFWISIFCWC